MSEYEAWSVATISGFTPPSRLSRVSRMDRLSRGVPGTTIAPIPDTWSLTALSQVKPRLKAEVLRRRGGVDRAGWHHEPDPVHRCQMPAAPTTRERDLRLCGDEQRIGRRDGVPRQTS